MTNIDAERRTTESEYLTIVLAARNKHHFPSRTIARQVAQFIHLVHRAHAELEPTSRY
jgi:hypothetical protein